MGSILTNGVFLPAEGERNCYEGLAANWVALDGLIGGYSAHAADLTIHVTAADKEAWNGKADASVLTAHTGNTTIHVTAEDKAKWDTVENKADASALTAHTGDTTIHVTAEDKNKWDAVTAKANDTDVLHRTGNETASGTKDFTDSLRVYNSNSSANTAQLSLKNSKVNRGQTVYGDQAIWFRDATDKPVTAIISRVSSFGASMLMLYAYNVDQNNQQVSNYLSFIKNLDGTCFLLPDQNDAIVLGSSSAKFKGVNTNEINGFNPGALSLPQDRTARVDISAYFTNTGNGTINRVTPTDDGYIFLSVTDVVTIHCLSQNASNLTHYAQTFSRASAGQVYCLFPVRKNDNVAVQWYTTAAAVSLSAAYFIPCKGNV